MDRYEYKVRIAQIKSLIDSREFYEAMAVADTIDWRRVRSAQTLCMVSEIYIINRKYDEAKEILHMAFERHPNGRSVIYALCELSIKLNEIPEAVHYLNEYIRVTSKEDSGAYVLQYRLYHSQGVGIQERIEVLKKLKNLDYQEKWAYELALLYHKAGDEKKCVSECDEMIVWFGRGPYVTKAMELKMLHAPLSTEQQRKYDHRADIGNIASDLSIDKEESKKDMEGEDTPEKASISIEITDVRASKQPTQRIPELKDGLDADDIKVTPISLDKYSTMNLQAELQKSMEELAKMTGEPLREQEEAIVPPVPEEKKEDMPLPKIQEIPVSKNQTPAVTAAAVTEKAGTPAVPVSEIPPAAPGVSAEPLQTAAAVPEVYAEPLQAAAAAPVVSAEPLQPAAAAPVVNTEPLQPAASAPVVNAESHQTVMAAPQVNTAIPPMPPIPEDKRFSKIISEEYDGQLSLNVPNMPEALIRQITGQLNIQDIINNNLANKANQTPMKREELQITSDLSDILKAKLEADAKEKALKEEALKEEALKETALNKGKEAITAEETQSEAEASGKADTPDEDKTESLRRKKRKPVDFRFSTALDNSLRNGSKEALKEKVSIKPPSVTPIFQDGAAFKGDEDLPEEGQPLYEDENLERGFEIEPDSEAEGVSETAAYEDAEPEKPIEIEPEPSGEAELLPSKRKKKKKQKDRDEEEDSAYVPADDSEADGFSEEEKEIFSEFLHMHGMGERILAALSGIDLRGNTGNIIITGNEQSTRIRMSAALAGDLKLNNPDFYGKVAKIAADVFNTKDIVKAINSLDGGALVIERAAALSESSLSSMAEALNRSGTRIVVMLEEDAGLIRTLEKKAPWLEELFNVRLDIPTYTNDDLVYYGREYAREQDYAIDDVGVLELYSRIDERQTADHLVTISEVEEIVDRAIERANHKSVKHFFDLITGKRYDDNDFIVLRDKHFAR